ncbi:glycoside hydrolase family 2 TIM barrel-domain containing protein [Niabella sp.]|uniref:glycoside hydrolase family 2 TIM barrel-domain containing protein n=1 Tax=Niabella sp. TaxID=1962976 RepID=UPI002603767D|nr:glycoside hydrolase family 2 TIM barrel-domain containing protein [Niabella sp.]
MKLRLLYFGILLSFGLHAYGQENISLNGVWQFALATNTKEAKILDKFNMPGYKSKQFKPIPVPSNWAILGYEEPVYQSFENDEASAGYYLKEFSIPPEQLNQKRIMLQFEGVWSHADVWLNGKYLGSHGSGFTPFSFEITEKINRDANNTLAVRVQQVSREYRFDVHDDWSLGGIYRDVHIITVPAKRWIDYVNVRTTFDHRYVDANLQVKTMITDRRNPKKPGNYSIDYNPYELSFSLFSPQGEKVTERTMTIPAHLATGREIQWDINVASPHQWTAETPYLYRLEVVLLEAGTIAQRWSEKIGFRQITTDGGILKVNGQSVKLRGVNRHDEHPDVGRATTYQHWLQDLKLMKAANINYIRCSHYTPAKGFIELCDSLGMYIGNEVSIGGAKNLKFDPSYTAAALTRAYETITREINNPSIIYWSVGNEDELSTMGLTTIKFVKALDPSRPVLIPWRHEEWLPEEIGILSAHYWQPGQYDAWAANSKRPVISTEYTHAYGEQGMGGLQARWNALAKHPAGAGAAIWMWADQGLKIPKRKNYKTDPKFNIQDEYLRVVDNGWDGIVDSYRNPTRDYWETKAVYAPVYVNVEKLNFVAGQDSVQVPVSNAFDYTNLSDIRLHWQVYEDTSLLDEGFSSLDGAPHTTGTLSLPLQKIKTVNPGKTYYSWFIFLHKDGTEITRCSVELCPSGEKEVIAAGGTKPVLDQGKLVTVTAGKATYVFDPAPGQLIAAQLDGLKIIDGISPTIWHNLDPNERVAFGEARSEKAVDLNRYQQKVITWKVEDSAYAQMIHALVEYTVDQNNRFTVAYTYTITGDGLLNVHYELRPEVAVERLPLIGMDVKTTQPINQLQWLGLGPYDAYPNKQAAPIFGQWKWDGNPGIKNARRVESWAGAACIQINHNGYIKLEEANSNKISVLTGVYARPDKQRPADSSFPELRTDRSYIGAFNLQLTKRP